MLAYSYVRFSHPSQSEGDSLRRQTERAAAYCQRNGLTLDASLSLRDLGVSAFKGKNAAVGNFRTFLDAIQSGKVRPGSALIVESFDRISRQGIDEGYDLIKSILKAGIRIVTLSPERSFEREATKSLSKGALEIQLILERAAEESERKSDRVGGAWANKRKDAAKKIVTRRVPGWIRMVDGKLELDKDAAETVRKVFKLARDGFGVTTISKQLNAERVPVLGRKIFKGRTVFWNETVVYHILTARSVIGEYQPCKGRAGDRQPVGDPVKNYYPAVIDEQFFYAVQNLMKGRKAKGWRGRRGSHVNLFAGLLVDARDGGSLTYRRFQARGPAIIPVGAKQGTGIAWTCFPAVPFEAAVLSKLREINIAEITGDSDFRLEVEALAGQMDRIDELTALWKEKMDNPAIVESVAAKLEELASKRRDLSKRLSDARQEAASPVSESWGEFHTLAELLDDDSSEELRVKVRAVIRRTIEGIYCLFTGVGRLRLAAVRVQFRGSDRHRDYVISYEPGRSNHRVKREGSWRVRSEAWEQTSGPDLRRPMDARKVEKILKALDPSTL